MAAAPQLPFVSEEEYLRTDYEPNCEYVDGVLEPKALQGRPHSILQTLLAAALLRLDETHRIVPCTELHLKIRPGRHRVPDLVIMPDSYLTDPSAAPLGIIEILSPSDPMSKIWNRIHDLHSLGARWTLIIDPENRQAFVVGEDRMLRHLSSPLRVRLPLPDRPELAIDLEALFAKLPAQEAEP